LNFFVIKNNYSEKLVFDNEVSFSDSFLLRAQESIL